MEKVKQATKGDDGMIPPLTMLRTCFDAGKAKRNAVRLKSYLPDWRCLAVNQQHGVVLLMFSLMHTCAHHVHTSRADSKCNISQRMLLSRNVQGSLTHGLIPI